METAFFNLIVVVIASNSIGYYEEKADNRPLPTWVGKEVASKQEAATLYESANFDSQSTQVSSLISIIDKEDGDWIHFGNQDFTGWILKEHAILMEDAVQVSTQVLKTNPTDVWALIMRSEAYKRQGEIQLSIKDLDSAHKNAPNRDDILCRRGENYSRVGSYDLAIADFNAAERLNPKNEWIYYSRAYTLRKQGHLDEALRDCNRAIENKPKRPHIFLLRGNIFAEQKDFEKASEDYSAAIGFDQKNAGLYCNRANVLIKLGKLEQAMDDCKQSISLNSNYVPAYGWSAEIHLARHQNKQAIADYLTFIGLKPNDPDILRKLAFLLATCPEEGLRDGKQAVRYAKKACELTGWRLPEYSDTLACAYAENSQYELAIKWEKKALEDKLYGIANEGIGKQKLELFGNSKPFHRSSID